MRSTLSANSLRNTLEAAYWCNRAGALGCPRAPIRQLAQSRTGPLAPGWDVFAYVWPCHPREYPGGSSAATPFNVVSTNP